MGKISFLFESNLVIDSEIVLKMFLNVKVNTGLVTLCLLLVRKLKQIVQLV